MMESLTPAHMPPDVVSLGSLAPDLLCGAEQIAEFLYGQRSRRRSVYHLAETSKLPVFRLGSQLCARRSVMLAWIAAQEKRGKQL